MEVFVGGGEGFAECGQRYSGTLASFMNVFFMVVNVLFSAMGSVTSIFLVPLER